MAPLAQCEGFNWNIVTTIVIFIAAIFVIIFLVVLTRYFRLYLQSLTTGANIGLFDMLGMTFRKINPAIIVAVSVIVRRINENLADQAQHNLVVERSKKAAGRTSGLVG